MPSEAAGSSKIATFEREASDAVRERQVSRKRPPSNGPTRRGSGLGGQEHQSGLLRGFSCVWASTRSRNRRSKTAVSSTRGRARPMVETTPMPRRTPQSAVVTGDSTRGTRARRPAVLFSFGVTSLYEDVDRDACRRIGPPARTSSAIPESPGCRKTRAPAPRTPAVRPARRAPRGGYAC